MLTIPEAVRPCLEKVLTSAEFARSRRMSRFLEFVVAETIAGRGDTLRERQIGIEVFDRPPDWDPKLDNIVRGEARRLRQKLEIYYATVGQTDAVRILIPKGGYCADFEQMVSLEQMEPVMISPATSLRGDAPPPAPPVSDLQKGWPSRRYVWFGGAALLLLAVSWAVVRGAHPGDAANEGNFEVVPVADEIGQEFDPAFSPDGRRLAYVWDGNGDHYDVYVKELASGRLMRVTSDSAVKLNPAWSPDGKEIAFFRLHGARAEVVLKQLSSGAERVLTSTQTPVSTWLADSNPYFGCHGPAWSPDGRTIVVPDQPTPDFGGFGLYKVDVASGRRTTLTQPQGESHDTCPHFAPDGGSIAYIRYFSHGSSEVQLIQADGSRPRQLTAERRPVRGLDWSANGQRIVYSTLHQGAFQLWQIDPRSRESKQLSLSTTSAVDPTVSLQTDRIAFTELQENWNIWRVRLNGLTLGKPEMLIASTGKNHSPIFSPDGHRIAFVSDRSGTPEIWLCDEEGRNLRQLTRFGGPWLGSIRFSPDGRTIAFDARPTGHSGIFLMPVAGGKPTPLEVNDFEERRPTWSADGRSIYFNSNRSGVLRIWKRSLVDRSLHEIGPPDTNTSTESADGSFLYFTTNHSDLWRCRADGSECTDLEFKIRPEPGLDWSLGSQGIYLGSQSGETAAFYYLSLADRSIHRLGAPERPFAPGTPSLTVSPDGNWLIYGQLDHISSDIKLRQPQLTPEGR